MTCLSSRITLTMKYVPLECPQGTTLYYYRKWFPTAFPALGERRPSTQFAQTPERNSNVPLSLPGRGTTGRGRSRRRDRTGLDRARHLRPKQGHRQRRRLDNSRTPPGEKALDDA